MVNRIQRIETSRKKILQEHDMIKRELKEKSNKTDCDLIVSLVELLIETGKEGEENNYWRTRSFVHFRKAMKDMGLDLRSTGIKELHNRLRQN